MDWYGHGIIDGITGPPLFFIRCSTSVGTFRGWSHNASAEECENITGAFVTSSTSRIVSACWLCTPGSSIHGERAHPARQCGMRHHRGFGKHTPVSKTLGRSRQHALAMFSHEGPQVGECRGRAFFSFPLADTWLISTIIPSRFISCTTSSPNKVTPSCSTPAAVALRRVWHINTKVHVSADARACAVARAGIPIVYWGRT